MRNIGGGRPQVEDRAAHGQMGKVASCFAERLHDSPWEPLRAVARRAGGRDGRDARWPPRRRAIVVDQLAREPGGRCAPASRLALESVAHPKQRLAFDALLVVGPEHGRVFREAGWDRARVQRARCSS